MAAIAHGRLVVGTGVLRKRCLIAKAAVNVGGGNTIALSNGVVVGGKQTTSSAQLAVRTSHGIQVGASRELSVEALGEDITTLGVASGNSLRGVETITSHTLLVEEDASAHVVTYTGSLGDSSHFELANTLA